MHPESLSAMLSALSFVSVAELGDKSQLMCMILASRYRRLPVFFGAATAFLLLNTLAVTVGVSLAATIPEHMIAAAVALLFAGFGLHALLVCNDTEEQSIEPRGRSAYIAAFSLLFLAELGDKTQLAVAGLASQMSAVPVWIGASIALLGVSALGVWIGSTVVKRLPQALLNRLSGTLFIVFAIFAAWRAISL